MIRILCLVLSLLLCATGCSVSPDSFEFLFSELVEESTLDYDIIEISRFQSRRSLELLDSYGFTDYTMVDQKRNYHYTAEDYKKIDTLDETYLYGMYIETTDRTLREILRSMGYENLNDYLIQKGYVSSDGEPSTYIWNQYNAEVIDDIMVEELGPPSE